MKSITRFCLVGLVGVLPACVTPTKSGDAEPSVSAPKGSSTGGYFVALDSSSSSKETLALYDGLRDAINGYNRKLADKGGKLQEYVEAYEKDGYTRLADDANEIECDLAKCLVKLTSRQLKSGPKDQGALAAKLTDAMAAKGLPPVRSGAGDAQTRTYMLGRKGGQKITCAQQGLSNRASYVCDFDLLTAGSTPAASEATLDPPTRGKLVSCAMAPGTVRAAEEARDELEHGELLELTTDQAGGKAVGFVRVSRQAMTIEFVDLFLCGDLSHDHFVIEGPAKRPSAWIAKGTPLESLHEDEAHLAATTKVVDSNGEGHTVLVTFALEKEQADTGGEVFGADAFRVRIPKSWVK